MAAREVTAAHAAGGKLRRAGVERQLPASFAALVAAAPKVKSMAVAAEKAQILTEVDPESSSYVLSQAETLPEVEAYEEVVLQLTELFRIQEKFMVDNGLKCSESKRSLWLWLSTWLRLTKQVEWPFSRSALHALLDEAIDELQYTLPVDRVIAEQELRLSQN